MFRTAGVGNPSPTETAPAVDEVRPAIAELTGGVMSLGAIVARELGVTCVINSKQGARDIPDGAQITVNGTSGRVIIHEPLTASGPSGG